MTHNTFLNFLSSSSAPGATKLERELRFFTQQQPTNFPLKVVSNEMNGGLDVLSIESFYYITQVLGLSSSFYLAVVFYLTYFRFRYVMLNH